jgi:hypothetical protein
MSILSTHPQHLTHIHHSLLASEIPRFQIISTYSSHARCNIKYPLISQISICMSPRQIYFKFGLWCLCWKIVKTIFKLQLRSKNFFLHFRNIMNLFFVLCMQEVKVNKWYTYVGYTPRLLPSQQSDNRCGSASISGLQFFCSEYHFHYYITCAEHYNYHVLSPICCI